MKADSQGEKIPWPLEIVRSERRRKGVSAELKQGTLIIRAPVHLSDEELMPIIQQLQERIVQRARPVAESDEALTHRAQRLNQQYFQGQLQWQSIRYVKNQQKQHGSCTPSKGTIRISDKIANMPEWVRDYVVMHEISHLVEANHSPRFWKLVNRYPLTERARGYLMALDMEDATLS